MDAAARFVSTPIRPNNTPTTVSTRGIQRPRRLDSIVLVTLAACIVGAGLGLPGLATAAFVATILASLGLLISATRSPAGYASLTVIFVVFFLAYGVIDPAGGGGLAGIRLLFPPPYETAQFAAHYCLACAGLSLGLAVWASDEPGAHRNPAAPGKSVATWRAQRHTRHTRRRGRCDVVCAPIDPTARRQTCPMPASPRLPPPRRHRLLREFQCPNVRESGFPPVQDRAVISPNCTTRHCRK